MSNLPSLPTLDELHSLNRELAALLRVDPPELATGAEAALEDDLVICGILGGKDVGKSTLINALAGTRVSVDPAEVGRGTERPMAYVHEAAQEALARRLRSAGRDVPFDVTTHRAAPIRNVVLVDMPDFDSEFLDHLAAVRAVGPLLDRVIWVLTPRKIGDRAWVQMLRDVVKDWGNVRCVVNKIDELLSDSDPFEGGARTAAGDAASRAEVFWDRQREWTKRAVATLGLPQSDEAWFLLAAAFPTPTSFADRIGRLWNDTQWQVYAPDRSAVVKVAGLVSEELNRLRRDILSPVSAAESSALKAANRDCQRRVNVERIRRHYDLDGVARRLARICDPDYLQGVLNEAVGQECRAAVAAAILAGLRSESELADELLARRVEHWPLLRVVYWPLGWLSRAVGRHAASRAAAARAGAVDPGDGELALGGTLVERTDLLRSRILAEHSPLVQRLQMESEFPPAVRLARRALAGLRQVPGQAESRVLEQMGGSERRPSILARSALWLVFLWFPFLQPVLTGLLEMFADGGTLEVARGAYRIISALSAPHLLAGFAVVAGVFVVILAVMYSRCLGALRGALHAHGTMSFVEEGVDEVLLCEVLAPLVGPFRERLDRLENILGRLEVVESQLDRDRSAKSPAQPSRSLPA